MIRYNTYEIYVMSGEISFSYWSACKYVGTVFGEKRSFTALFAVPQRPLKILLLNNVSNNNSVNIEYLVIGSSQRSLL